MQQNDPPYFLYRNIFSLQHTAHAALASDGIHSPFNKKHCWVFVRVQICSLPSYKGYQILRLFLQKVSNTQNSNSINYRVS